MFLLLLAELQASILRFSLSLSKNQASVSHLKGLAQLPTYKTQTGLPGPEAADPWICIRNVGCPPPRYFPDEGRHRWRATSSIDPE